MMGKRSRSKPRPKSGTAASAHDGAAVKEQMIDDRDGQFENDAKIAETADELPSQSLSKSEKMWNTSQSVLASNLLPLISRPEDLLTSLLSENNHASINDGKSKQHVARQQLLSTSQQLFQYIEHLASMEEKLKEMQKQKKLQEFAEEEEKVAENEEELEESENEEPCGLSGIPSLYTGQTEHDEEEEKVSEEEDAIPSVDAETIWGQVDLQNNALLSMLKKSIKKLGKRCSSDEDGGKKYDVDDQVRILDTGAMMGDDDSGSEGDDSMMADDSDEGGDMMSMGSAASDFGDELNEGSDGEEGDNDSDEDSEARRIRERMEKAMADMSGDESNEDGDRSVDDERQRRIKELAAKAAALEEEAIDPAREDMRDGFFDLHEMEAFADEEEEMLPDDAYGEEMPEPDEPKKKNKKKTLPHLKDRMGGNDSDSEDEEGFDDEDAEDELVQRFEPTGVRRKKYRADDEVEALYKLYDEEDEQEGFDDSDDEGGEVDASNMTAADFFGKPDKKLIQSYKDKQKKSKGSKKKAEAPKPQKGLLDDDADSWDEHNFEDDGMDWKDKDDEDEDDDEDDKEQNDYDEGEDIENDEDEDGEEGNQKLSAHAIQSKKLEEQTLRIEQDMMAEKPWKMMGEAKGTDRGTDSLLDSTPEFEVAFKPPPILTQEHTTNIEEMIKKRIIDEDWDDVVPRELPDIGLNKRGGGDAPEVSQEKSKLGLGELYEREYLKKTTGYDRTADEKQTEEDAAKEEMKELFANLCSQLDALSNYHFAPRPVADEADVKNREDVPAIAMEEVLPLHVSQSRGVAPEEVYAGGKGRKSVLKGESELDQAERKRVRAAKKAARRKERKQKHADEKLISKLQPGLGLNNPYEKRKLREELQMARASGKVVVASDNKAEWGDEAAAGKEYQTSTKFFAKMQENVESMVRGDDGGGRAKKRRKGVEAGQSSSSYRL